jgi:predicted hydrocarbon binding protein
MTQGSSLTHLAYRSCLDTIEDLLGRNGLTSVLRFVNLEQMIENPPDYDPDARVGHEDVTKLFTGVRDIMGDAGYGALMYRGGLVMVKNIVSHSAPLKSLIEMDFDPVEKLKLGYTAYLKNAGYDPERIMEHLPEKREFVIHREDCTECDDIIQRSGVPKGISRPSCAFVRGCLKGIGNCFEREVEVSVTEEVCRLTGDSECRYRVTYRVK